MSQDYDKIFRENLAEIILPLVRKTVGLNPSKLENLPEKLQRTVERIPDFLKKVVDSGIDPYILHIEIQTTDTPDMVYRMLEYAAMMLRKYKIVVRQYVFYIGEGRAKMPVQLETGSLRYQYILINLSEIPYQQFISSNKPEELILTVLADFQREEPREIISQILQKLHQTAPDHLQLGKFIRQLEILSQLRNFNSIVSEEAETMAQGFDITIDRLYKKGREEGLKDGEKQAWRKSIFSLLRKKTFSIEQIAELLEVPVELVADVQQKGI
jgi:predicted transposase/invertase (TIGR01784 family)